MAVTSTSSVSSVAAQLAMRPMMNSTPATPSNVPAGRPQDGTMTGVQQNATRALSDNRGALSLARTSLNEIGNTLQNTRGQVSSLVQQSNDPQAMQQARGLVNQAMASIQSSANGAGYAGRNLLTDPSSPLAGTSAGGPAASSAPLGQVMGPLAAAQSSGAGPSAMLQGLDQAIGAATQQGGMARGLSQQTAMQRSQSLMGGSTSMGSSGSSTSNPASNSVDSQLQSARQQILQKAVPAVRAQANIGAQALAGLGG